MIQRSVLAKERRHAIRGKKDRSRQYTPWPYPRTRPCQVFQGATSLRGGRITKVHPLTDVINRFFRRSGRAGWRSYASDRKGSRPRRLCSRLPCVRHCCHRPSRREPRPACPSSNAGPYAITVAWPAVAHVWRLPTYGYRCVHALLREQGEKTALAAPPLASSDAWHR